MSVFSDEESALLDQIAIDMALDRLSRLNRTLIVLHFAYELPDDYAGPWPPRYIDTGRYISRHLGKPLRDTGTRVRTTRILEAWCRAHEQLTISPTLHRATRPPFRRAA